MRDQEIIGLYESYQQVYSQPQEEVEQLDENVQDAVAGVLKKGADFMKTNPVGKAVGSVIAPVGKGKGTVTAPQQKQKISQNEETDLFDYILEHLVAEGYADTNKAALAIMANMSEEWKQSIMEGPGGKMMMSAASRGQASLRASIPPQGGAPRRRNPNEGGPGSQNPRPRLTTGQQMSAPRSTVIKNTPR